MGKMMKGQFELEKETAEACHLRHKSCMGWEVEFSQEI